MAKIRLQRELKAIQTEVSASCRASPVDDDIFHWRATVIGPDNSPFSGGHFNVDIQFPPDYPFKPPKVAFLTKVYHPNISEDGSICLDTLKDGWSPTITIPKLLLAIGSLLTDPNPDDPMEPVIAYLYKNERAQYDLIARAWTQDYAMSEEGQPSNQGAQNAGVW